MDFIVVLDFLLGVFEREKVDFAFIGGFAVQAAGVERATKDVDFLILTHDLAKIKPILLDKGYAIVFENQEMAQFVGKTPALGRVDFLLAHRKYALSMLKRARVREWLGGKYRCKVAVPEDVIGLKIQAIANNPLRRDRDFSDIKALLKKHGKEMDMELVREYFRLFEKEGELDLILRETANAP